MNEARQAMLLARVGRALDVPRVEDGLTVFGCDRGPSDMTPRDALRLATRGGAEVLGRAHELGQIKEGYCADIAMFRTDTLSMAGGAVHDPVGALLLCASDNADYTIVNGRVVVRLSLIHISEPTRPISISYAVFCLKKSPPRSMV